MRPESAFVQAVINNPDDDTPRLVYADWLEEHDQPERAEFIRLQVELARPCRPAARHRALAARQRELLAQNRASWGAGTLHALGRPRYRRGFVESVRTNRYRFLRHADEVFEHFPIREVRFVCASDYGRPPALQRF